MDAHEFEQLTDRVFGWLAQKGYRPGKVEASSLVYSRKYEGSPLIVEVIWEVRDQGFEVRFHRSDRRVPLMGKSLGGLLIEQKRATRGFMSAARGKIAEEQARLYAAWLKEHAADWIESHTIPDF